MDEGFNVHHKAIVQANILYPKFRILHLGQKYFKRKLYVKISMDFPIKATTS